MTTKGIYYTLITQLDKLAHRRLRIHECFRLNAVAAKQCDRGILFCGTGIGVMLAANKVKGAYAANVGNVYVAKRACLSNNCNITTIGCQTTGNMLAKELISAYLECEYVYNERSGKKVDAIVEYEQAH